MSGLVLLDEDQQRSLYERQQQELAQNHTRIQSGFALDTQNFQRARPPPAREPRTDFTGLTRPPPRTDFTSGDQGLPRTDFTSRGQAATTSSTGKPSISTNSSSGTAIATGDLSNFGGGRFDNNERVDSYPILRDDDIRESSTGTSSDHNSAAQYAGTSSGLKISVRFIMAGVVIGLVLGIVLSQLNASSLVAQWVSLPGDLFLRALKCLVVPYVFCSVAVAVGDIVFVGKVSVIGLQTAKIFFIFWLSTVVLGVAVALIFRPFFRVSSENAAIPANSIGFTCANNMLLSTQTNGSIACSTNSTIVGRDASFVVTDVNDVYEKNTDDVVAQLSISDQIMQMITPIVSGNIVESLADGELLSVITFSMVLGSIAGQNFFTKTRRTNYLYLVLLQLRNTFFLLMEWTIWLSPVAVISIIAGSFATNQEAFDVFSQVYPYLLAVIAAGLLQVLVLYPLIVFLLTRCNPYSHMKQMVRAYMFAFACSSSLATMPVTLSSIKKAKVCSQSVANFVISIGAVSNISGMGFYMPIALVFMAESSGNGDQLTVLRIVGIFVLSLLACSGTPPIPASGLVVISTAYTTLFGEIPSTFAYVVAFDFIADRISTTCNVNDDLMALKIISETTDETVAQDHLGERF